MSVYQETCDGCGRVTLLDDRSKLCRDCAEEFRIWYEKKHTKEKEMDTAQRKEFRTGLLKLLNRHSAENGSDTPDYILADYLVGCLDAYNDTLCRREEWYGRKVGEDRKRRVDQT